MTTLTVAAANLKPLDAQLAQIRLAEHGIRSRVENLELVTWLWHMSIAFHGVRVVVAQNELQSAVDVLSQGCDASASQCAFRECSQCHDNLPTDWDVRWRCGTDSAGICDDTFFQETVQVGRLLTSIREVNLFGAWLLLVCALVIFVPAFAFACLLMLMGIAIREPSEPLSYAVELEPMAADLPETMQINCSEDESRRALASAMFGIQWFAPWSLHSVWILCSSHSKSHSAKALMWRRVAWVLNTINLAIVTLIAVLIVDAVDNRRSSWRASNFVSDFIDTSSGMQTPTR